MRPGQKPPTRPVTVNGVTLGPNSPMLAKAMRVFTVEEFAVQAGLLELLVGEAKKGKPRTMGEGLTGRIPSLYLIHAISNSVGASKATQGKRKAEGVLVGMPDLHWPVMRGPFIGLYLETKRPGGKARVEQRAIHEMLRLEGHAVLVYDNVQRGLDRVLAYHALGENRPSVRPVHGSWPKGSKLDSVLAQWRLAAHALLDEM